MRPIRLARRFALIGLLVSILFFSFWALEPKVNFFHLPTADEVSTSTYKLSSSRALVQRLNLIVCPPLAIMIFGMDMGAPANFFLATIVVLMNGALYFTLGLLVGLLWDKFTSLRT
jgi:hypothetical protein